MSAVDFQIAIAKLIASPQHCVQALEQEHLFFSKFDLTEKEKKRLRSIVRQHGMSACCSLYRMNRLTPIYMQLGNTSLLLGEMLIPVVKEFWDHHIETSLQFKEEVLEFGKFLLDKIEGGLINIPYLKEVLKLEIALNEINYLKEGKYRIVEFEYDVLEILQSLEAGHPRSETLRKSPTTYKLYMDQNKLQMHII